MIAQIDAFREELLGYAAAADRSGDRWDALRVALDTKLLAVRTHVERWPVEWAERLVQAVGKREAKGPTIQVDYPPADLAEQFEREAVQADKGEAHAQQARNRDHETKARAEAKTWRKAKQMVLEVGRGSGLSDFEREAERIRNLR